MISPPTRRLWLYPAPDGTLEIILLGGLNEIAWEFSVILRTAERWPGFLTVDPIAVGTTVLGMRCTLGPYAVHDDPVAEALAWLSSDAQFIRKIEWTGTDSPRAGRIGTW